MSYIDDYLPICEGFEGRAASMYLDTKGNVSVAVGLLIANAAFACTLPFLDDTGTAATAVRVSADFGLVSAMQPGHAPAFYSFPQMVHLAEDAIDELTRKTVMQFDADLRESFDGYDEFPDSAKMALLDMEYNLGDPELRRGYPNFDAAVNARIWVTAAAQCGRNEHDPAFAKRNAWTRAQFLAAAGPSK